MASINLVINGKKEVVEIDPSIPVLWVLREYLHLEVPNMAAGLRE